MSISTEGVSQSLMNLPDEILVKIMKYFHPRDREPLAKTCRRLRAIVYGDKQLLRNLDFSKNGCLTTRGDIWRYFLSDVNACDSITTLNLRNVNCLTSHKLLLDSVGKATNLIELDIRGTKFKNDQELGGFLKLFKKLKKLSFDWPETPVENSEVTADLVEPFGRLTYLSVRIYVKSDNFLPSIALCGELRELRIETITPFDNWRKKPETLENLEVVQISCHYSEAFLKAQLAALLPDWDRWMDFRINDNPAMSCHYLEKNVQVCDELAKTELKKALPEIGEDSDFPVGWYLLTESLFKEITNIKYNGLTKEFCCLRNVIHMPEWDIIETPCYIRIDDAKMLLKDPWHEISYVNFQHSIEPDCDVHLIASAFPRVKELVLSNILKYNDESGNNRVKKRLENRLRRQNDSPEVENQTDDKSSFELLIENTQNVEDLTIYPSSMDEYHDKWDFESLYLIPNWKNLRNLRMAQVPVKDGKFLIHIGINCPNLEILIIKNLGINLQKGCCYASDLCEMLINCKNLKEFSLYQSTIDKVPEILDSLVNNTKLEIFRFITKKGNHSLPDVSNSIIRLINSCKNLTKFRFMVYQNVDPNFNDGLVSLLRRMKDELNRPGFQFQILDPRYFWNKPADFVKDIDVVHEDEPRCFFPKKLDRLAFLSQAFDGY